MLINILVGLFILIFINFFGNGEKIKYKGPIIKCPVANAFCSGVDYKLTLHKGLLLCYDSQFGHMGFENGKPIKLFETSKKDNQSLVDKLCQKWIINGTTDNFDLRGMLIFYNKQTKIMKIHSSIFVKELHLHNIEIYQILQFFVDNMKLDKRIMESSSIDKNYMEELKISPTKPVLDDYAGLFALKYDMILGKLEKNDLPIGNRTVMLVNIEKIVEKVKIKTTSDQNKTPMISPISKFTKITHNKTPLITFPIAKFTTKTTQNTTPRMISPFTKFTTKIKETITTTNHATSTRPDCLLKYHPAEYNGYGCFCGIGTSGTPHDDIDKCCEKHDKCQTLLKNKCSSTIDNPFDIFSISLFASNYKWKCEGGGSTIQCLDNDDECQKLFCNCDKILIECLSQHTKPKQRQPCWSNINETIKEATRKPIEAVESIKFDVVKAKEDVKKFSNAGRNFDKKKAREAIDAAVKASKDFLSVTKKIHEENDKKLKKAESDFKAAVEKARKSKSFDDWKAADQAMAQVGITIMEIETVGRKIDEVIKIGLESAKEVHYLAIRMEDG